MRQDHQNERPSERSKHRGEVKTETGEMLKGPLPSKLPQGKQVLSRGGGGEERTPDRPIGQSARADRDRQLGEAMEETQLDEGKPGREKGNELSANTNPTRKKTGEF